MITEKNKENIIKGLEAELENGTFYQVNQWDVLANTDTDFYHDVFDLSTSKSYATPEFKGVGLFRPLVSNEFNPLNSTVYNYKASYEAPVHGMAFTGKNGEYVESHYLSGLNLGASITNEFGTVTVEAPVTHIDMKINNMGTDDNVQVNMADILPNTQTANVIDFASVPQELALAKRNHWKDILFMDVDIIGSVKKLWKNISV
ncbi:MAG: hypothetical protein IJ215_00515 [Clostridia bacterium]|nr:hypothetical protein [Clostridia bacterium]